MEENKPLESYSETGGVHLYGAAKGLPRFATWPHGTITIQPNSITISTSTLSFTFKREEIREIKKIRILFSVGIQIIHSKHKLDAPDPCCFWTVPFSQLFVQLDSFEYEVKK